MMMAVP